MLALLFRSLVFFFVVVSAPAPDVEPIVAPETGVTYSKGGWGETKVCFQLDAAVFPGLPVGSAAATVMVNLGMQIKSKGEVTVDMTVGGALSSKWLGSVYLELVLSATFTSDKVKVEELTGKKVAEGLVKKVLRSPFARWTKMPPAYSEEAAKNIRENIAEISKRIQVEGAAEPPGRGKRVAASAGPPTLDALYEMLFADETLKDVFVQHLLTMAADFVKKGVEAKGDKKKLVAIYREWLGGDSIPAPKAKEPAVCDFDKRHTSQYGLTPGLVSKIYLCSFLLGGYFLENPGKQAKALKNIKKLKDEERKEIEAKGATLYVKDMYPQDKDDSIATETIEKLFPRLIQEDFCKLYADAQLDPKNSEKDTVALIAQMDFPKQLMMIAMPLGEITGIQKDIEKQLQEMEKQGAWIKLSEASMQLHLGVTGGFFGLTEVATYGCTPDTNVIQGGAGYQWMFNKDGSFERGSPVAWVIVQDPSARFQFQFSYCSRCGDKGKRKTEFAFELRIPDSSNKKELWRAEDFGLDLVPLYAAIVKSFEKVKAELQKLAENSKRSAEGVVTAAGAGLKQGLDQAANFLKKKVSPDKDKTAPPKALHNQVLLEVSSQTGVESVGQSFIVAAKKIFDELAASHGAAVGELAKLGMCEQARATATKAITGAMLNEAGKLAAAELKKIQPLEFTDSSRIIVSLKTTNNLESTTVGLCKDRQSGVKATSPALAAVHAYFWRGAGIELTGEKKKAAFVTIMEKGRTRPESLQP
jgi:hypothetical protein